MYLKLFIIFILGYNVWAINLKFENELTSRFGIGWPPTLDVAEGNEALMKLSYELEDQQSCTVSTPTGLNFDVDSPPGDDYQRWGDGCGVRLRHVRPEHEGRWRLTASRNNDSLTGWIELTVLSAVHNYQPQPISLRDGEMSAFLNLSTISNEYCLVAKPFSESSLLPGHCNMILDRTTRSVQGNWNILLGLPGQVAEIQATQHVAVEAERLDTGYINDASAHKLHLYCNILHSTKYISFCRFQKTSSSYGYNIVDGLSDGNHSYYGDGFAVKQCGMTVENPTSDDYVTWRCSVGVTSWINNRPIHEQPMQALINVHEASPRPRVRKLVPTEEIVIRNVFVQENMPFTISCNADMSLTYCWFRHPNGSQYTPMEYVDDSQLFWYAGESLDTGDCGITFLHASMSDAGQWICHMGPRNNVGIEKIEHVNLRVTGALAANQQEVSATIGEPATLYCHSSNGRRPLHYCRFLSPFFKGFNIDSSFTEQNAIDGKYYFTEGRHINYGDCSLTIINVQNEDVGKWTCAAIVDNQREESRDTVTLFIEGTATPQYRAGIIGMSVGLACLVTVLIGYISIKRGWISLKRSRRQQRNESRFDEFSLRTMSSIPESTSSEESNNRF